MAFNFQVYQVTFYKEDKHIVTNNTDMEVNCRDGQSFLSSHAVVVTVLLTILNDGDIQFSSFFGTLPGKVSCEPN